jgi:hypothetical protein
MIVFTSLLATVIVVGVLGLLIAMVVGGSIGVWAEETPVRVLLMIVCFSPIYSYFKGVAY